ncbi:MAG: MarR family transcriptional regulator [Candidatus Hermodarchaeota archaeon]
MEDLEKNEVLLDILNIEEEIMNFFEDIMYDRGGSPLLGRIYGLCVMNTSNRKLSQKGLVRRFKVNSSTISRNLRELEKWRLIQKRRQPGSTEWEYQVEPTSFLELLAYPIENQAANLPEKRNALLLIREHWINSLTKEAKQNEKARRVLKILDALIEWISIVINEMDSFIRQLRSRYLTLEDKITSIWSNSANNEN